MNTIQGLQSNSQSSSSSNSQKKEVVVTKRFLSEVIGNAVSNHIFSYLPMKECYSKISLVCERWSGLVNDARNNQTLPLFQDPFLFRTYKKGETIEKFNISEVARPNFGTAKFARVDSNGFLLCDDTGNRNDFLWLKRTGTVKTVSKRGLGLGNPFNKDYCFHSNSNGVLCRDLNAGVSYYFKQLFNVNGEVDSPSVEVLAPHPQGYELPASKVYSLSQTQFGVAFSNGMFHVFENSKQIQTHDFSDGSPDVSFPMHCFDQTVAVVTTKQVKEEMEHYLSFYDPLSGLLMKQETRKVKPVLYRDESVLLEVCGENVHCYEMEQKLKASWSSKLPETMKHQEIDENPMPRMVAGSKYIALLMTPRKIVVLDRENGTLKGKWTQTDRCFTKFLSDNLILQAFNMDTTLQVWNIAGERIFNKKRAFITEPKTRSENENTVFLPQIKDVAVQNNEVHFMLSYRHNIPDGSVGSVKCWHIPEKPQIVAGKTPKKSSSSSSSQMEESENAPKKKTKRQKTEK